MTNRPLDDPEVLSTAQHSLNTLKSIRETAPLEQLELQVMLAANSMRGLLGTDLTELEDDGTMPHEIAELIAEVGLLIDEHPGMAQIVHADESEDEDW